MGRDDQRCTVEFKSQSHTWPKSTKVWAILDLPLFILQPRNSDFEQLGNLTWHDKYTHSSDAQCVTQAAECRHVPATLWRYVKLRCFSRALTLFDIIWHCLTCSLVMHRHARWPLLGLDTIVLTHLFLRLEKHNSEEIEGPFASLVHVCIFFGTCDTDSSWTLWYNIPYTSAFYAPLRLRKVLSYHVHVFVCVLLVFCFFYPTKFI